MAQGFGPLENLAFDGRGGVLLSQQSVAGGGGSLQRLGADGSRSVAAADVDGPGAVVIGGATAYFTTGNSVAGLLSDTGTISALDLDTGAVRTVASGLTMPNGLARLPGGDFVVSRDLGPRAVLTRVTADGTRTPFATSITSTNGLVYSPRHDRLFVSTSFDPTTTVAAVDISDPSAPPARLEVPGYGPANSADDLTIGPDGRIYLALNAAGAIDRIDQDTGAVCTIADGLPLTSSVRFGAGRGWDVDAIYATSFLGTVTRIARA
ncbi:SMP-30/gluconolactonase/LRE family protein [Nocardia callitridis]|uniref:SMP-30/gluconolactonase/LRE family protein n=1 Tax=Nocardia callitridis TaxID=648753 RepID=UPI0031EBACA8